MTAPKKRGTRGLGSRVDPLETPAPAAAAPRAPARPVRAPAKVTHGVKLPPDLLEQARDAVVALSGPPTRLTLAGLVENGIRAELARLQRRHNDGKPFPPRGNTPMPTGRPIDS